MDRVERVTRRRFAAALVGGPDCAARPRVVIPDWVEARDSSSSMEGRDGNFFIPLFQPMVNPFLQLPGPIKRSLRIFNARNSDGRSRTTILQISNLTGRKLMAFTKEEYEGLLKISDEIKKEIVILEKKS